MELDTSSYYPKSHLDDEFPELDPVVGKADESRDDQSPLAPEVESPEGGGSEERSPRRPEREPAPTALTLAADRVSTFLSWVMVPLLMPVYGLLLAFGLSILQYVPTGSKIVFVIVTAVLNIILPAIVILLLKRIGIVRDIGLNDQDERFWPYFVAIVCLGVTAWFVSAKGAPMWLTMFYAGGAAAGIVELVVNRWWKISVHAAGVAGIVALLVRIMRQGYSGLEVLVWLCVAIGVAGFVGAARIWLGRHTVGQVMAGYAVGFCGVFFMTMIN